MLLAAASLIGVGSSTFHPEASRVARLASGGRFGTAQSTFQVGGNTGSAIGPLMVAAIVIPFGQHAIAWFMLVALLAIWVLLRIRSEEHTSELQSPCNLVCRLLLEKKTIAVAAAIMLLVAVVCRRVGKRVPPRGVCDRYLNPHRHIHREAAPAPYLPCHSLSPRAVL